MVVYRAAAYHTPLWLEPNVNAGRFNRPLVGPVQYFCEHPVGPLAEMIRRLPAGLDPAELRVPVWALRLPGSPPQTLGFDEAADWGLDASTLVSPPDAYGPCQALGTRLLGTNDPPVLRVPSAALPGTWNVVVFGERVLAPYAPEPLDPSLDVPGAPVAVGARALAELVPMVRPLDARAHAAYDAWRAGREHTFVEPVAFSLGS